MHMRGPKQCVTGLITLSWTTYMDAATKKRKQLEEKQFATNSTKLASWSNSTRVQSRLFNTTPIQNPATNARTHNTRKTLSEQNAEPGANPVPQQNTKSRNMRELNRFRWCHPTAWRPEPSRTLSKSNTPFPCQRAYSQEQQSTSDRQFW